MLTVHDRCLEPLASNLHFLLKTQQAGVFDNTLFTHMQSASMFVAPTKHNSLSKCTHNRLMYVNFRVANFPCQKFQTGGGFSHEPEGQSFWGPRGQSPSRTPKAEILCIHCLQILTSETHKIWKMLWNALNLKMLSLAENNSAAKSK